MTATTAHWSESLPQDACKEAVEWARTQGSLESAWATCHRADWMLWLAGRWCGPPESDSRRKLVLCACACARTSLHLVPASEDRPRIAIETAERWARGEDGVTLDDVRRAANAAAYAAAYAAAAASADAYAAAAYSADAAYSANAANVARAKALADMVDIVREHYPQPPEEIA